MSITAEHAITTNLPYVMENSSVVDANKDSALDTYDMLGFNMSKWDRAN